MPRILKNLQICHLKAFQGLLQSPKVPKREPLTFKFHDMICSNEFLYPWDPFLYITYLESEVCSFKNDCVMRFLVMEDFSYGVPFYSSKATDTKISKVWKAITSLYNKIFLKIKRI